MDRCTQKIEYYIIRTINLKGCTIVYSLCTFLHFIHHKKGVILRVNKYNKVQTDKTNMRRIAIYLLCIFMLLPVVTMTAQPGYNYSKLQREKLNRGVVAIRENPSEVIVSWRYLSSDPIQPVSTYTETGRN